jgi:hypothetical protein
MIADIFGVALISPRISSISLLCACVSCRFRMGLRLCDLVRPKRSLLGKLGFSCSFLVDIVGFQYVGGVLERDFVPFFLVEIVGLQYVGGVLERDFVPFFLVEIVGLQCLRLPVSDTIYAAESRRNSHCSPLPHLKTRPQRLHSRTKHDQHRHYPSRLSTHVHNVCTKHDQHRHWSRL